jgi:hypothetical protein
MATRKVRQKFFSFPSLFVDIGFGIRDTETVMEKNQDPKHVLDL